MQVAWPWQGQTSPECQAPCSRPFSLCTVFLSSAPVTLVRSGKQHLNNNNNRNDDRAGVYVRYLTEPSRPLFLPSVAETCPRLGAAG